jgi:hypothetical protein
MILCLGRLFYRLPRPFFARSRRYVDEGLADIKTAWRPTFLGQQNHASPPTEHLLKAAMTGLMGESDPVGWLTSQANRGKICAPLPRFDSDRIN